MILVPSGTGLVICKTTHDALRNQPWPTYFLLRPSGVMHTLLSRRGIAFDKAFQALKLLLENAVDLWRPLLHAAADVAADDIALGHIGAALAGFQRPAERPIDTLHLQRAERTAQPQPHTRRGVDDLQMLDRAAIVQPLAKAAPSVELEAEVGGVAREGVRRAPPAADLAERGIDPIGRCRDHGGGRDLEPVLGDGLDLRRGWPGKGKDNDERRKASDQHRSRPDSGGSRRPIKQHVPGRGYHARASFNEGEPAYQILVFLEDRLSFWRERKHRQMRRQQ